MGLMDGLEISWAYYGLRGLYVDPSPSVDLAHNLSHDNNGIRAWLQIHGKCMSRDLKRGLVRRSHAEYRFLFRLFL